MYKKAPVFTGAKLAEKKKHYSEAGIFHRARKSWHKNFL